MSETGRVLRQALALGALAILVAAAVHLPLVKRFIRGEFRGSFFQASEFPGVRLITLAETEDLWRTGEALVLDARSAALFGRGHIPGARNLPASETKNAFTAGILETPKSRTVLVYCEGGACQSSLALAGRLHDWGFTDIRVFGGGWEEWTKAGLPEEKEAGKGTEEKGDGQE